MVDEIDRGIILALLKKPRTITEIVREEFEITNPVEIKKSQELLKYRLHGMIQEGFVVKDKKTRQFSLENITAGYGTLILTKEDGAEEMLEVGLTILVHNSPDQSSVIFLENAQRGA